MELIGYDLNRTFVLSAAQRQWFEQKEQELGIDLQIITPALTARSTREEPIGDRDKFIIYDCGTPADNPLVGSLDVCYGAFPGDLIDTAIRTVNLRRRSSRRYKAADFELMQLGPDRAGYEGYQWYGHFDYKTMWTRWPICNVVQLQEHTVEQMMDIFWGPYIEKALNFEYFSEADERRRRAALDAFLNYVEQSTGARTESLRRQITASESNIASFNMSATREENQLKDLMRQFQHAQEMMELDKDKFEKNFIELSENVNLESVAYAAAENSLMLTTKELYLYSPNRKTRVPVGKFAIHYFIGDRYIKIFNLTNTRSGRQHPHVPADGIPCFGGSETHIRQLAAEGELVALTEMMIQFLETYNPADSWGMWASHWFAPQREQEEHLQSDGTYLTKAQITEAEEEKKKQRAEARKARLAAKKEEQEAEVEKETITADSLADQMIVEPAPQTTSTTEEVPAA